MPGAAGGGAGDRRLTVTPPVGDSPSPLVIHVSARLPFRCYATGCIPAERGSDQVAKGELWTYG